MFEAFQLGPFLFRSSHLFLLLGVWLGGELFLRIAAASGVRVMRILTSSPWFLLSFLLCGRLLGVLLLYRIYVQDPYRLFIVWDGVFSLVGGCIGIGLALLVTARRQRETLLRWLDMVIPPMVLLIAVDWVGRFFGALSYGKPTDVPWGVVFESMGVRYTVPIHPVQLYYALWFFALTLLLLALRKKGKQGMVTLLGIVLGCIGVIVFEPFRGDFAVTVFVKLTDFAFLVLLFASLGAIAIFEWRISQRYSLVNGILLGLGTAAYLLLRPSMAVAAVEWRFSQFLAVLAILGAVVYVVMHRWKKPRFSPMPSSGF